MTTERAERETLSRDKVMRAAVDLADTEGIAAVTMRQLGQRVGVEAMSLYHHVPNKAALLDGMADVVIQEVNELVAAQPPSADWKAALRARILLAREVMLKHPWAVGALEQRTSISPPLAVYYDGVLGIMRSGGFSFDLAHHALHALGSRVLGFNRELFEPSAAVDEPDAAEMLEQLGPTLPNLAGMFAQITHEADDDSLGWCDDQAEFEFGLDLLLDGLATKAAATDAD